MTPWAFSFYHSSRINKVDVCMYICINSVKIWWGFVKKREGSRACRNFTFLNTIRHSVHSKRKTVFSIRAQVATIIIICSLLDFIKCYNWGAKSLWGYHNDSYQNHHLAHKIVKRRKIICLEKKKSIEGSKWFLHDMWWPQNLQGNMWLNPNCLYYVGPDITRWSMICHLKSEWCMIYETY